jgi:small-conductance mechanosensitive channel
MRKNRWRSAILVSLFLLVLTGPVNAAEQKAAETPAPPAPKPAPVPPPAGIALADIATRATEVSTLLGNVTASAAPSAQIETIAKTLPGLSKKSDAQLAVTTKSLEAEPTLQTLQTLQQQWHRHQLETTGWLSTLTQQATKLQGALNHIADLQKTWSSTRASAQATKAPDPILQQIDATLTAITAAQAKLQSERTALLDLQSRVAQEVTKSGTALAQIGQIQQKAVSEIFVPATPPIWRTEIWAEALKTLPDHVRSVGIAHWSDIVNYLRDPREGGALHAALFVVLALVFSAARRKIASWEKSGADASSAILVFERPYAAAAAIILLGATSPFFQWPSAVRQLLFILALVPMIRLARPMVSSSVVSAIYTLGFLFAIDSLRRAFDGIQVVDQTILFAENLTAIVVLIWLRRQYRQFVAERAESFRLIFLKLARLLLMIVLIFSLLAGMAGYARLARLLTPGIFAGGFLALAAFAYLRVFSGAAALALRVWPLRMLQMVAHHRELLERRVYRLLIWTVVIAWLTRYLNYLGLLDPAWSLGQALLTTKLERGSISISLGNVLEFFLAIWLAHLLSRFLRFALQEDFYPRINLAPGLSYAVSSLLNYIILALGFVAALGVLGVDFTKVSIMAGAFGVGLGFGLQSIVNNFVSGLILLFERPIHVGDSVQVGNLLGRVLRIGIRASVLRTMQGAEIIVPNAQLISDQVTNWTLSDQLRRLDLPVGVNYGATPKKVIELLEGVARAHPKVLREPPPRCLFLSYGDSSINFELRAWTEYSNSQQVHSDLTVAVYDAVYGAGMTFPFPQRDVHLMRNMVANSNDAPVEPFTPEKKSDRRDR